MMDNWMMEEHQVVFFNTRPSLGATHGKNTVIAEMNHCHSHVHFHQHTSPVCMCSCSYNIVLLLYPSLC